VHRGEKAYRIPISILFGLAGLGLNFFDIKLFESSTFVISLLPGLVFPLLISLVWGWEYGLLSALFGGCQSLWWLWYGDGWGILYSVPVFFLWVLWHGYWAKVRRKEEERVWYHDKYWVELPFRLISGLGFYTLFRFLVSMNPPPWDHSITSTDVPLSWVHMVTIKHIVSAYVFLLFSHALLSIRVVRRFFHLRERTEDKAAEGVIASSLLIAFGLWIVHSVVNYLFFNPDGLTFIEETFTMIRPQDLFTKSLFVIFAMVVGLIFSSVLRKQGIMKKHSDFTNRILRGILNVNQLITTETDREKLLTGACKGLVETQGYFNVWIALLENGHKRALYYKSGIFEEVELLEEMLDKKKYPPCVRKSMVTEKCQTIKAPEIECPDCPFNEHYQRRGTLVKRLQYGEEFFGTISASIPREFVEDPEEKILFNEVAGDISYALYNLEVEEKRAEAEAAVQRDLLEKEILIKEIHHRVKNNLNVIASLLNLQSSSISSPEEAQEALKKSYNRIYSMAQIHNSIYQDDSALQLNMPRYIHSTVTELIDMHGSGQSITPIIEVDEVELPVEKATPLGLIILELVTNSLKHAFINQEQERKEVKLSLKKKDPRLCELKVIDNGKGLPKDLKIESSETLGFQLVTILTDQIEGTLSVEGNNGTAIALEFAKELD